MDKTRVTEHASFTPTLTQTQTRTQTHTNTHPLTLTHLLYESVLCSILPRRVLQENDGLWRHSAWKTQAAPEHARIYSSAPPPRSHSYAVSSFGAIFNWKHNTAVTERKHSGGLSFNGSVLFKHGHSSTKKSWLAFAFNLLECHRLPHGDKLLDH